MMTATQKQYVVLLHGLGASPRMLRKLQHYLVHFGYDVHNIAYPSRRYEISDLAKHVYAEIEHCCPDKTKPIHFVTHSMGSIIARVIFAEYRPDNLGRVVMIAPPNNGTEVVDFLKRFKLFRRFYGPAGSQLGATENIFLQSLAPIDYELGIIAGSRTVDPWFTWLVLPGAGDGKVTIESTKVMGMRDHITLPASHNIILKKRETLRQVVYFLQQGQFDHQAPFSKRVYKSRLIR